jgi:hypothetical protein
MKSVEEVYKALLNGKSLTNGKEIFTIKDEPHPTFIKPELWEIYDKFANLKKAYTEGAIIECRPIGCKEWEVNNDPLWVNDVEYRIKDDITIEQWNIHKDVIKAYWKGKLIEFRVDESLDWSDSFPGTQSWCTDYKYRIKPSQWEMKPAGWAIDSAGDINTVAIEHGVTPPQKFGMKFHTENQAHCARNQMRKSNVLRYWASTLQEDLYEGDYYIYLDDDSVFRIYYDKRAPIGTVTMKKNTAVKLCDALNDGDLKLL